MGYNSNQVQQDPMAQVNNMGDVATMAPQQSYPVMPYYNRSMAPMYPPPQMNPYAGAGMAIRSVLDNVLSRIPGGQTVQNILPNTNPYRGMIQAQMMGQQQMQGVNQNPNASPQDKANMAMRAYQMTGDPRMLHAANFYMQSGKPQNSSSYQAGQQLEQLQKLDPSLDPKSDWFDKQKYDNHPLVKQAMAQMGQMGQVNNMGDVYDLTRGQLGGRQPKTTDASELPGNAGINNPDSMAGAPQNAKFNPYNGQAVQQAQSSNPQMAQPQAMPQAPGGRNEVFLKNLPPGIQGQIKSIADYNLDLNTIPRQNRARIINAVMQYDPTFDEKKYPARSNYLKDVYSGKTYQQSNSVNTIVHHLGVLNDAVGGLQNGDLTPVNGLINYAKQITGDPSITDYNVARNAINNEMGRLLNGIEATEGERKTLDSIANQNSSPAQLRSGIVQMTRLMNGRLTTLQNNFKSRMGREDSEGLIVQPENQQMMQKIMASGRNGASDTVMMTAPDGKQYPVHRSKVSQARARGLS